MVGVKFPYKAGDVVRFPDTESETVDVGVGMMKVAETLVYTVCEVVKRGRGVSLCIIGDDYSEVFGTRGYIPILRYLEYFGDYKDLEYVCKEEELDMNEQNRYG